MKKILSLLALVLMSCMGAWAQTTVELTTDESNPRCYMIESYDRGGVLTSNGAGQSVTHVDMSGKGYWYFTKAQTNTTNNVAGGVIAHNLDGTQLTNAWKTAAEGNVVYILPNGVNNYGLSICKNPSIQGSDCIDAQNGGRTGVGDWSPSSDDWQGTTWKFTPVELPAPAVRLTFSEISASAATVTVTDGFGKALSGVTATLESIANSTNNDHALKTANLIPTYGILSPNYNNEPNGWWELTFKVEGLNNFVFNYLAIDAHGLNAQGGAQTSASKLWKTDFKLGTTTDNIANYATAPAEELVEGYYSNPLCHHTISAYGESDYTTPSTFYITVRMTKTQGGGCHAGIASIELTKAAPKVNVTYTITNPYNETYDVVAEGVIGATAEVPAIDFFSNPVIAETDKTISADNNHFNVTGTWNFPFEEGKKYTMKAFNSSKFVADGTNAFGNNSVTVEEGNDLWQFEHVANTLNLYKVKNVKYGYATVASDANQTLVTFAETATPWTEGTGATSYFRITPNGTGFNLQHPATATANAGNHVQNKLGFWNHTNSPTDNGSRILVEEYSLNSEMTKAIATVNNLANLAGAANVTTATTAINSASSIDEINTALSAYYATLNGKKFTYESRMYNQNRYLQATDAAAQLATSDVADEKTAKNVFEFEHVSGNTFKVKAPYYNAYLNKLNTSTTASNFELIVYGAGYVALQFAGESNAIHHQASGNLPVSWDTTSDASKWYIAPVTNEEWEALANTPDWDAFAEVLNKAKSYTLGDGLGQYTYVVLDTPSNDIWAPSISYYEDVLEAHEASANDVNAAITAINGMIANLQINLPEKGTFLRIKGGVSGNYVAFTGADNERVPQQADGTDAKTIIYYAEDGTIISYYNGKGMTETHSQSAVGGTMDKATFTASNYGIGKYCIKSNSTTSSQVWYDHSNAVNRNSSENSANCAWVLEEVTALPVSVSAAGYATLYAPVALSIPTGVEAYTLTLNGDYLQAAALTGKIPANTAVVLKANEGNYNFDITTADAFPGSNVLEGTVAAIAKVSDALVLGINEGEVGFYTPSESVANFAGFKAYYVNAVSSNLRITFEDLTSIISVAQQNGGQAIYDLQGRRVVNAHNGLYIINGKKVIK